MQSTFLKYYTHIVRCVWCPKTHTAFIFMCTHDKIDDFLWNRPDSLMFAFLICPCMMIIRAVNWMIIWHKCRPLSTLICHRSTGNLLVICPVVYGQFAMWHLITPFVNTTLFRFTLWTIFVDDKLCLKQLVSRGVKKNWIFFFTF